jgi:hypothetical protein
MNGADSLSSTWILKLIKTDLIFVIFDKIGLTQF